MANPRDWYSDSRETIKEIYGEDWRLVCAILAATSGRASLPCNVTLARKAYNQIKQGYVQREGFINAHYKGLLSVIKTSKPRGRKCNALYQNLIGNETEVPVDIWMMRYSGLPRTHPTRQDYDWIEDNVRQEAKELGITTAQRQAEIWVIARKDSRSYADYLRQYRMI